MASLNNIPPEPYWRIVLPVVLNNQILAAYNTFDYDAEERKVVVRMIRREAWKTVKTNCSHRMGQQAALQPGPGFSLRALSNTSVHPPGLGSLDVLSGAAYTQSDVLA